VDEPAPETFTGDPARAAVNAIFAVNKWPDETLLKVARAVAAELKARGLIKLFNQP
jgi:hypothetical protein